jgi:hypothetical protein
VTQLRADREPVIGIAAAVVCFLHTGRNQLFLVTSKSVAKGETILLCQKKKQLNARTRTSVKANRPVLRLVSLCAKKWNTFEKANTAPARQNKRSPLAFRKRGGPE